MKYTEQQLERLVDQLNDERKDRDLEDRRQPQHHEPKPPPPRRQWHSAWPFMERPNGN